MDCARYKLAEQVDPGARRVRTRRHRRPCDLDDQLLRMREPSLAPVQQSVDQQARVGARLLPAGRVQAWRDQRQRCFAEPRSADRSRWQSGRRGRADRSPLDPAEDQRRDEGARRPMPRQADLLRNGVELSGSSISYNFTKLNDLKPADDRRSDQARPRAAPSNSPRTAAPASARSRPPARAISRSARATAIATERVSPAASGSPFQKVRVVTTVDYDIDAG